MTQEHDKAVAALLRKRDLVNKELNIVLYNDLTMRLERLGHADTEPESEKAEETAARAQSEPPRNRGGRPRKNAAQPGNAQQTA